MYKDIIITDFKYFKISEEFEEKIRSGGKSVLDDDLRETHLEILIRFYAAFQSVHKYVLDLNAFVENLQDYNYGNLDSIFQDKEGSQLLVHYSISSPSSHKPNPSLCLFSARPCISTA